MASLSGLHVHSRASSCTVDSSTAGNHEMMLGGSEPWQARCSLCCSLHRPRSLAHIHGLHACLGCTRMPPLAPKAAALLNHMKLAKTQSVLAGMLLLELQAALCQSPCSPTHIHGLPVRPECAVAHCFLALPTAA